MSDYDFHTLSPLDFEDLTRDLLQARDGVIYESFRAGRDGGIDVRHSRGRDQTVVQCKHYARSGFALLKSDLAKEAPKILLLKPKVSRYIVATTVDLSAAQKQQLSALFTPPVPTGDILGRDDLNNLLGLHPEVEKRHFKLWLSSTAILDRVVHNVAATKSDFDVDRVRRNVSRFVRGAAYPEACKKLETEGIVILSGPPGVGKSTLADILLYEHLERGFKAISARNDFDEARALYTGGPAVFYYDDFLGATYLGDGGAPLRGNEDRTVTDFIEFVKGNAETRLILTTRGHLLSQAIESSERIRHAMVDRHELVVRVDDLSEDRRARVLYNHIWFGDLSDPYRDVLLAKEFYLHIIRHPKFSPRLVEWMTDRVRIERAGARPDNYRDFVERMLNDPSELWQHAYDHQIGPAGQSLLLALHSLRGRTSLIRLERVFNRLHTGRVADYGLTRHPSDFKDALRHLTTTFVTINKYNLVTFLDPSVMDLMNAVLRTHPQNALDIIKHASTMVQISQTWSLSQAKPVGELDRVLRSHPDMIEAGVAQALATEVKHNPASAAAPKEVRATDVVNLGAALGSSAIEDLVGPLLDTIIVDWTREDDPPFDDGVDLIYALEAAPWAARGSNAACIKVLQTTLLSKVGYGVSPWDAERLLGLEDAPNPHIADLEVGLSRWLNDNFSDQLDSCRSSSEYKDFLDALTNLDQLLPLDLSPRMDAVQTAWDDFEGAQEAYAESQMDAWRDHRDDARFANDTVHELFDSLRRF
ncbi:restriction endonuclease [Brevundimonas sp.]|uniref:nSTAND3 domain-containing NTPase n=1 Tax=Brevundimonas sp. TaxID=1871086 RepID=UPI002ABC3E4C|nr:restriction endonuclease [Brevundimonas sp.]MDZ4365267.1 restriction endonuclease [Brevundimonas sp.]